MFDVKMKRRVNQLMNLAEQHLEGRGDKALSSETKETSWTNQVIAYKFLLLSTSLNFLSFKSTTLSSSARLERL